MSPIKRIGSAGDTIETELLTFPQYQERVAHLFPSVGALEWFFKMHRSQLLEAGAVIILNRRRLIRAPVFDRTALSIGQAAAKEQAHRQRLASLSPSRFSSK
jgi:hypothetical protein